MDSIANAQEELAGLTPNDVEQLHRLAELLFEHRSGVAFTGAGISTESGIPDYRGPNGVWKRIKPTMFRDYLNNPEIRMNHWKRRVERYPELASKHPNDGHRALARLQQLGYVQDIITQNIDGLHQKAGSAPSTVIELHGSAHHVRCLDCGRLFDAEPFDREFNGEEPACPICDGMVKESTIAFGQPLVADDLRMALMLARASGVMIVVGSSLSVHPAAKVPREAAKAGAELAIINNEPTPLDSMASVIVRAPSGASLAYLADRLNP